MREEERGRGRAYTKHKGNILPIEAWTDPECSRRLRLPDLKTVGK
jgi:hypothetical protein